MVKFKSLRMGHPFVNHKHNKRSPTCNSPLLYKTPSNGASMQVVDPLTVSWDTSYSTCLGTGTTNIDIYLLSPSAQSGHVKIFSSIPFTSGTYTQNLDPAWWNNTGSIQLSINLVPTGQVLAFSPFAAGPVISVNSTAGAPPSGDASDSSDPSLKTTDAVAQGGGLPKGSVAAVILLPIIVILVGLGVYIKISRKKRAERSRRFSRALNARMSRISGDWQVAGEKFGPRESTASGLRMSNVFGPGAQMDVRESVAARVSISNVPHSDSQTVGSRTSRFNPPTIGTRQSRISFAPDVNASKERLSIYSAAGRGSRSFLAADVPPVPRVDLGRFSTANPVSIASGSVYDVNSIYAVESHEELEDASAALSPTQTNGPIPLSNDDINNIDIAPALSLMRSGNPAAKSSEDLLLAPPVLAPPAQVHAPGSNFYNPPLSPVGAMPMQPQTATPLSPDDMLKQYAIAKAARNAFGIGVTSPTSTYSPTTPVTPFYTTTGMRNLTGDPSLS